MSTLNRSFRGETNDWQLITLGVVLVVASLLVAGWLLLVSSDLPGGISTLLLTVSGALLTAIGITEPSHTSA
ncbi:hypothetical protein [Halorhabdus rudnickae]|uniref:hypothetical protein n=1 Tax=Halorhabdus rudnickae TaxID=1775544 RepID=UPI0010832583|nr:hypothetical protein [Halorhabdus rudnickae]